MKKKCLFLTIMFVVALSHSAMTQDFSITIDGEKDAWYNGLTGPEDGLVFMPAECYLRDIGDGTGPDDDDDLSAIVWMAHDSVYLYLYAEVTDDMVEGSNGARYLNDCLELKFDPEPYEGGSYTVGLNTRLTALEGPGGSDNLTGLPFFEPEEGTDYVRALTDDGYALEFRLLIESLETSDGRSLAYNTTGKMGLAINIGDNDSGTRDDMLQWSAGHADAVHTTPKLLGTVTFLGNHKLGFEAVSIIDPGIVNTNAADWYSNPNPTGIHSEVRSSKSFELLFNYPNPFNPDTKIQYQIKIAETATLAIYNIQGKLVRNLIVDQHHTPGAYEITWNGRNQLGTKVSSGIYIYRLLTASKIVSNKMMLMK